MKKIILMMLILLSVSANAQKDVTKFLGIPVDGYKTEMKKKLIDKGFTYDAQNDRFEGEFNGQDVYVYIVTNNNKVWRIAVSDANVVGETDIKIRFNKLCNQFEKNDKYIKASLKEYRLSESDKIAHEILVNKKRYEATFYQKVDPELMNTAIIQQKVKEALLREYTQEQIDNPTEEQSKEIQFRESMIKTNIEWELMEKKFVWFMINELYYGRYYITMFYDNEYNHSDGEDL